MGVKIWIKQVQYRVQCTFGFYEGESANRSQMNIKRNKTWLDG
jgi:hypothetical protein